MRELYSEFSAPFCPEFGSLVLNSTFPRRMPSLHGKIPPAGELGARPMAGQLTLDQSIEVRILCPQPDIWLVSRQPSPRYLGKK